MRRGRFKAMAHTAACYTRGMKRLWPDREALRRRMLEDIAEEARICARYTGRPVLSDRVLEAMRSVPREDFVPSSMRVAAFDNAALPVGHGQTISQPFIVALMTDLLDLEGDEKVLEIGTGTGYQTAILGRLAAEVHSIECRKPLHERARETLAELGTGNIRLHLGDGWQGWPDAAPYDAIIVTAAPERLPERLIEQLASNGRMVLPVGPLGQTQWLTRVIKDSTGRIESERVLPVAFVPMIHA